MKHVSDGPIRPSTATYRNRRSTTQVSASSDTEGVSSSDDEEVVKPPPSRVTVASGSTAASRIGLQTDPVGEYPSPTPDLLPIDPAERSVSDIPSADERLRTTLIMPTGDETRNWLSNPTSPSSSDYVYSTPTSVRIGNSAWGPSWMSPNPRLDFHSKDNFLGWPSIPEHGVFDRYDLYSGVTMAQDFASDAGNRHSHSYLDPAGAFPGFTHHHYAGDLISGAGVLPGQDFEYMSTTSGTSQLDGRQTSLRGMDDFGEVLGIEDALRLEESSLYAEPLTLESFAPSIGGIEAQAPASSLSTEPFGDVDLRGRGAFPPAAPTPSQLAATREDFPLRTYPFTLPQQSISPLELHTFEPVGSHHRSSSQPPAESRPSPQRSPSLYEYFRSNLDDFNFSSYIEPLSTAALDLHYGTSGHVWRQDSAVGEGTSVPRGAPATATIYPSVLGQRPTHGRGQSFAASPSDWFLTAQGSDRKRKRASWDGQVL